MTLQPGQWMALWAVWASQLRTSTAAATEAAGRQAGTIDCGLLPVDCWLFPSFVMGKLNILFTDIKCLAPVASCWLGTFRNF